MKVFLVRHGRSADREAKVRQSLNTPLSQSGINQAQAVVDRLKSEEIDIIYSSPYLRAAQTAEIISKGLNLPLQVHDLTRELARPSMDGLDYQDPLNLEFMNQLKENLFNIDWKFPADSESFRDVAARASKFRDFLISSPLEQNILVISHGFQITCFIGVCILGDNYDPLTFMKLVRSLSIENTSISEMEYFPEDKRWKVKLINDHLHIQGI